LTQEGRKAYALELQREFIEDEDLFKQANGRMSLQPWHERKMRGERSRRNDAKHPKPKRKQGKQSKH
jgi:hypothetical protein